MASLADQALQSIGSGIGVPTSVPSGPYLVTLPGELLIEIMKMLDADPAAKLKPLSRSNRLLRGLSVPILFQTMRLSTNEDDLLDHLNSILDKRVILDAVRTLGVYSEGCSTYRTPYQNMFLNGDGENCKRGTAVVLADVLFDMPNLQDLKLDLRFRATVSLIAPLRRTLKKRSMQFPLVTALTFPMKTDLKFIPDVFPNLRALSLELHKSPSQTPDLAYISQHVQLEYLEIWKARWLIPDVDWIPNSFPNVTHLTIGGMMSFANRQGNLQSLSDLTPILQRMDKLRVLAISNDSFWNLQTRNVKGFNRAGIIPDNLQPAVGWSPRRGERMDLAYKFFAAIPDLEVMYIMDQFYNAHCFVPTKDETGRVIDAEVATTEQELVWPAV